MVLASVPSQAAYRKMASMEDRTRAWCGLAELIDLDVLNTIYTTEKMSDITALSEKLLRGEVQGRVVIDVNQ